MSQFARQRWRNLAVVAEREWTPPRPVLRMLATTDYCTRDSDGSYINPHLYRVPISVPAVTILEQDDP